jgi:cysteine-rich repeat protein
MRIPSRFYRRAQASAAISCAALLAGLLSACTDEKDSEIPAPTTRASSAVSGPDAEIVAECDQAADGSPCGERGRGLHCLFNDCVRNVCGDGIRAEEEECDDGNERNGDSCSERCLLERCGNRVIDPHEECDDGNTREEDDICSNMCKTQMLKPPDAGSADPETSPNPGSSMDSGASAMDAGGSNMDAGTATDTGSATDTGGPDTGSDAGGTVSLDAAALSDPRSQACRTCMESVDSSCRAFQGTDLDLIAGCFKQDDPIFAKQCANAFFCSLSSSDLCAGDLTRGAVSCYCGVNRTIDECFKAPTATTGPIGACIPQWESAANCAAGNLSCVSNNLVTPGLPSFFAAALVTCAVMDCASACWNTSTGLIRDIDAGLPGGAEAGAPENGDASAP